jgi:TolB-like protein
LGIAALLIMSAAGGLTWFIASRPAAIATGPPALVASQAPGEAKHLSIVVLPFTNLSGDPAQDYFGDGITENLTTDLSRAGMFVIARATAFTYKGKSIDAKEIGKELGVRYVLEGSVQRDQNRVRVNAQLIDAESGAHLWADRLDEDVADLFKLQDQVVEHLGRHLDLALTKAEAEKGGRSKNPDAVDLTMRGNELLWQCPKEFRDCNKEARDLFERALKIEPNDVGLWPEAPKPMYLIGTAAGATRGPTMTPKSSVQPIKRSISPPTIPGYTSQRPNIWACRAGPVKPSTPPTPDSPSIRMTSGF